MIIKVFVSALSKVPEGSLTPAERDLAAQIEDPVRRANYERTRAFVRGTLGKVLERVPGDLVFGRGAGGKPFLVEGAGWEFSLTHSGPWIALVIARRPVGIDVEVRVPRDPVALAKRFFHPADAARICSANGEAAAREFARQWVAKEAALKAAGTGIAGMLDAMQCEFEDERIVGVSGPAGNYAIRNFVLPDGAPGAVAWEARSTAEVRFEGPALLRGVD